MRMDRLDKLWMKEHKQTTKKKGDPLSMETQLPSLSWNSKKEKKGVRCCVSKRIFLTTHDPLSIILFFVRFSVQGISTERIIFTRVQVVQFSFQYPIHFFGSLFYSPSSVVLRALSCLPFALQVFLLNVLSKGRQLLTKKLKCPKINMESSTCLNTERRCPFQIHSMWSTHPKTEVKDPVGTLIRLLLYFPYTFMHLANDPFYHFCYTLSHSPFHLPRLSRISLVT